MNLDNELKEYLSWAYEIGKKDGNGLSEVRKELSELIEAYVTTRVKEAERLARIDELNMLHDHQASTKYVHKYDYEKGKKSLGFSYLSVDERINELVNERTSKKNLHKLTTTTNGKGE